MGCAPFWRVHNKIEWRQVHQRQKYLPQQIVCEMVTCAQTRSIILKIVVVRRACRII